jgi:Phage major capsid protein E
MGHEAKTADDVFYRSMSMPGANNDSRDAELLVLDLLELDNDISRREEWMVSQALFTGKIVCLDGNTNEIVAEVDYTPISQSVVNPLWSSASTCDHSRTSRQQCVLSVALADTLPI